MRTPGTAGRSVFRDAIACDAVPMPILLVKAKPSARVSSLTQLEDGTWLAQLKSPPVDGKANAELVGLVSKQF